MAGTLLKAGIRLSPSPDEADIVIINTCSFIKAAREESVEVIRNACRFKKKTGRIVIVAGCLPQKEKDTVAEQLPDVDAFIGVDELDRIPDIVRRAESGSERIHEISGISSRLFEPALPGMAFSSGAYAYIKIAEGCNHPCSFCTIPSIRGRHRSRTVSSIVREAEKLLETGFREITLVSQDSTSYGRDLPGKPSLAGLLKALDRIGGSFWIRFLYSFPGLLTPELLGTMASLEKVCRYIDVPIQHSHPDILAMMKRGSTARHIMALPAIARGYMPDVSLRTTVITGFPGETRVHFEHLAAYLKEAEFDHAGVFPYSPEPGTPAAAGKPVSAGAVSDRVEQLLDIQSRIFDSKAQARKGSVEKVLLETEVRKNTWLGRTAGQAPEVDSAVQVTTIRNHRKGSFIHARHTSHSGYTLRAKEVDL